MSTVNTKRRRFTRLVIYPKDIMVVTGKSERNARYLHRRIKQSINKQEHQLLTIKEFCEYMGLEEEVVEEVIF